jgi:hypothetical protein
MKLKEIILENEGYKSSPHGPERSLLQKAVRRGNVDLVKKVFGYLLYKNDKNWLKERLVVMEYEECWTNANLQLYPKQSYKLLEEYKTLTKTIKNKNADGLADLAIKSLEGKDTTNVGGVKEQKAIKTVANAIENQDKFWKWIKTEPDYSKNKQRINAAERDIKTANFLNDKVMMLAAAYLALRYPIPETKFTTPNNAPNFPYWIAIDKHTAIGRSILLEACEQINLDYNTGKRLLFYLEGGKVNQINHSPFWDLLVNWQIGQMGYNTLVDAKKTLNQLEQKLTSMKWFQAEVKDMLNKINNMLNKINNYNNNSNQFELL